MTLGVPPTLVVRGLRLALRTVRSNGPLPLRTWPLEPIVPVPLFMRKTTGSLNTRTAPVLPVNCTPVAA